MIQPSYGHLQKLQASGSATTFESCQHRRAFGAPSQERARADGYMDSFTACHLLWCGVVRIPEGTGQSTTRPAAWLRCLAFSPEASDACLLRYTNAWRSHFEFAWIQRSVAVAGLTTLGPNTASHHFTAALGSTDRFRDLLSSVGEFSLSGRPTPSDVLCTQLDHTSPYLALRCTLCCEP